ncbi:unnamed protein product [Closterium sp. NIES-54]
MATCQPPSLSLVASARLRDGSALSHYTRCPHAIPALSPQARRGTDVSTPRGTLPAVAAWGRREPSSLRGARIIVPRRSGAIGAEDTAGKQRRRFVVHAGKSGFGDGGGREKSKGKGKGKGKEKEKGKRKGKGNDKNETVTVSLLDEGGDVGDMSEADLEAAIEALFAQLASDLEADADVDGTGFAAGDVDVELDDDELAALQVELDAALAEMTAEVEKEGGVGEGEVDEEERALVAELGLEEEGEEEEDEGEEEWEGGLWEQTEGSQEMGEVMAKGTASGEGEREEAGKKEEGVHDVAGAMAGAIAAGVIAGSGMGSREAVAGEKEQRTGTAEYVESGAIVGQGQEDPMGKRSDKSTQKGGSLRDNDWQGEEEEDAEEESSGAREGARREVQLQRWQLKKLALAVQKGRRHINVKALAAEAHLPRRDVLAFLRHPPDIYALFPDLPSPSTPPAPGEGAGEQEAAVVAQSGAAGAQGEGRGVGEKGGGEGKGADRLGMSEEGKKEWQERWKKGKRIRQEHLSTLEAVYQRSKYPTNAVVANLVSVTHLPRRRILQWFEDRRARTETGRAQQEMRGKRR